MKQFSKIIFSLFLFTATIGITAVHAQVSSSQKDISIGSGRVNYDNRVKIVYRPNKQAVMLYAYDKGNTYIQHLDESLNKVGNPISIAGLEFYDIHVDDYYCYVLAAGPAGYSDAPSLIKNYNNILYFLKISKTGQVITRNKIMGHKGHLPPLKPFLCSYAGKGKMQFDGQYFHVFVETCGNWAQPGQAHDVHETDFYATLDKNGKTLEGAEHFWKTSHSSMVQMTTGGNGKAFTLTVGDGSPWGINFYQYQHGKKVSNKIIFPDQTKLPYKDMYGNARSSTDAGLIGGIVHINGYLYTVISTVPVERHPIKDQAKNLLFVKWSPSGQIMKQKWITNTSANEMKPYVIESNGQIMLLYYEKGSESSLEGKAKVALLNTNGDFVQSPKQTNLPINWHMNFFTYPNGDIGYTYTKAYASKTTIVRLSNGKKATEFSNNTLTQPDNTQNGSSTMFGTQPENNNAGSSGTFGSSSVRGKLIAHFDLSQSTIDLSGNNSKIYLKGGLTRNTSGVYTGGSYAKGENLQISNNSYNTSNFSVEVEFKTFEYQDAPVFSLSRSCRILAYVLTSSGNITTKLNNGKTKVPTNYRYSLNTWNTARIDYSNGSSSFYLNGKFVKTVVGQLDINCAGSYFDLNTTDYGNGSSFKGYIRKIKVYSR